ncbi:unnamed protein product [Cylindrotheca closterium]|uniref:Uncharacterized protein n=1 Tax=Cylindrotheca closterium TaxID=2856 RepID=A0AAD2CME6_9STRA|nr:unnamed protein product [Cylindrotheca closterium]
MAVSEKPRAILEKLGTHYMLKPDSIAEPTTFLGATISKRFVDPSDSRKCWSIGSTNYLLEALRVVKSQISHQKYNLNLKRNVSAALPSGYKPELDNTDFVDAETHTLYMQLIGILRWLVELGRMDVCAEVSMMSLYNAMPCVGHFHAVLHLFGYLETHQSREIVMDSAYVALTAIPKSEWHEFYPWAKEVLPPDMPEALGRAVKIMMFVDASHASNLVTRQSGTGDLGRSSFGSEFAALKTGVELVEGLVYKLQMMGVPIDNNSVVMNASRPESVLKKKSNSVVYHYVCLKCASDLELLGKEPKVASPIISLLTGKTKHERLRKVNDMLDQVEDILRSWVKATAGGKTIMTGVTAMTE